jgi:hypothetical protein
MHAGHNNSARAGGSMVARMSPQQQLMASRYLQEMRRANDRMMASQGSGSGPSQGRGISNFASTMSTPNSYPTGGYRWPQASSSSSRDGTQPDHLPSSFIGGYLSMAQMQDQDPATRLFLLQQEQERLENLLNQPRNLAGSSPAKRQHLPTSNMLSNANRNTDPWMPQSKARLTMPTGVPEADSSNQPAKKRKRHVKSFPVKLMEAITKHYDEGLVAWLPDGKSFVVVDQERFVEDVLLDAFKGGKYTSFVRKLNRWKFRRLTSNAGVDCFHNPLFLRERPELCNLMTSGEELDDTFGVNPQLLGHRPSLDGIEKFLEMKKEGTQAKQTDNSDDTKVETKEDDSSPRKPPAA